MISFCALSLASVSGLLSSGNVVVHAVAIFYKDLAQACSAVFLLEGFKTAYFLYSGFLCVLLVVYVALGVAVGSKSGAERAGRSVNWISYTRVTIRRGLVFGVVFSAGILFGSIFFKMVENRALVVTAHGNTSMLQVDLQKDEDGDDCAKKVYDKTKKCQSGSDTVTCWAPFLDQYKKCQATYNVYRERLQAGEQDIAKGNAVKGANGKHPKKNIDGIVAGGLAALDNREFGDFVHHP